jgi:hypothetical protein
MLFIRRQALFTIFCVLIGLAIAALGVLVVCAQCIEWWNFGNWNPVSVRYAVEYFERQPSHFISRALGVLKIFNWLREEFLDLPLSVILLGIGSLIAAIGGKQALQTAKHSREISNRGTASLIRSVRDDL